MRVAKKSLKNIIIAYDCAEINGGGAKVAIQSAIALARSGYKVCFFAATGPVDQILLDSTVEVTCLGMNDINHGSRLEAVRNGIWNNTVEIEFAKFLSAFSPIDTVIHIHGWAKSLSSAIVKVACEKEFKTFITLHDYFTLCPNGGFYNYQLQEICSREPMSASCVFCNCDKRSYLQKLWRVARQFVQDKHVRNNPNIAFISISQKNEDVVKPFVRSKKFYRINNPIQMAERQVEDCKKSNIFLYVGRLSEEKGIELFCKAITGLQSEFNIQGVVVGDGVLADTLKMKYSNIQFEGWKTPNEVQKYILTARALVLPSKWYEGAPLTIIEAMSAGLPCIVSDCTSATELIKDSENGYIFKANDVESLRYKIVEALDNKSIYSIQKTIQRKFDRNRYSDSTYTERLIEVYQDWISQ